MVGIAQTDETAAFITPVCAHGPGEIKRLVRNKTDGSAVDSGEASNDALVKIGLNGKYLLIIHDRLDDPVHVINAVRLVRDNFEQPLLPGLSIFFTGKHWREFVGIGR